MYISSSYAKPTPDQPSATHKKSPNADNPTEPEHPLPAPSLPSRNETLTDLLEEISPKPSSSNVITKRRRTGQGSQELTATPNIQMLKEKEVQKNALELRRSERASVKRQLLVGSE